MASTPAHAPKSRAASRPQYTTPTQPNVALIDVTDDVPVARHPLFEGRADRVEQTAVEMSAGFREGRAAPEPSVDIPRSARRIGAGFLVPRHAEVERRQDHDREEGAATPTKAHQAVSRGLSACLWWASAPRRG